MSEENPNLEKDAPQEIEIDPKTAKVIADTMRHRLNDPLGVITGYADLLKDADPKTREQLANEIIKAAENLASTVGKFGQIKKGILDPNNTRTFGTPILDLDKSIEE